MTSIYISASTNRQHHAGHCWPSTSLVAIASHKFVALWDTKNEDVGVSDTLYGHIGEVTCVHFAQKNVLLSTDNVGELILWIPDAYNKWKLASRVKAHDRSISALSSHANIVVTGSSDATIKVWRIQVGDDEAFQLVNIQSLDLQGRYAIAIAINELPSSSAMVMAVGSTDRNVVIFTCSGMQAKFTRVLSLPGHDDWIRSLSFSNSLEQKLLLATGSQDNTIRIWKIESPPTSFEGSVNVGDDLLDSFEASLEGVGDEGGRQISLKRHVLAVMAANGSVASYHVTFDALLVGHEAGVTSVAWRPQSTTGDRAEMLLSTSTDSSVILWVNDMASGLWLNIQRFGDIGGQKLGGFVGGLWASYGDYALAWGWSGGWRRWRNNTDDISKWEEVSAITGHQGIVRGLTWSPDGAYLLTTSYDQSSRIHGAVRTKNGTETWHELGRPQVHGYDLIAAVFVSPLRFVSIADERVARVFDAPRRFTNLISNLGVKVVAKEDDVARPVAASVAPLQLSNKADSGDIEDSTLDDLSRVPFEGEIATRTLWPESEKIFGHGYELIAIGVSFGGDLIATACKATTAEHAVVRVYDTKTWQPIGRPLDGHTLTVTRIRWSPDDLYILTVSRDRTWRLFGPRQQDNSYSPCASSKSHTRIVWDCAWAQDGSFFVTAARDKTARVWAPHGDNKKSWTEAAIIKLEDGGTAVDMLSTLIPGHSRTYLAVGHENGKVTIFISEGSFKQWKIHTILDSSIAGLGQIYQLAWQTGRHTQAGDSAKLAICGEDRMLRLLNVRLD